uniref:Uncharacterized protein n=1 Tax=Oryzias latipes TaxID=8090 RepID=A0A3P9LHA3_ORYLA
HLFLHRAHLLLFGFSTVVRTLADCPGFFVKDTPPVIPGILEGGKILNQNRYKVICQTYENKRRFLTLYDTENKIPVFSAYRFTGAETGRPKVNWRTEPQLGNNQALDIDYVNNLGYDRGHLYPNSHAPDWDAKISTFTLTNVVPQSSSFNSGKWRTIEKETKCLMEKNCINASGKIEAFVVVLAEPGETKLNNKINIPSRMGLAFCCYNSTNKELMRGKPYWENNEPKSPVSKKRPREDLENSSPNNDHNSLLT